jgi:hypothetical protein
MLRRRERLTGSGVLLRVSADEIGGPVRVGLRHTEITQRDAWAIFSGEAVRTQRCIASVTARLGALRSGPSRQHPNQTFRVEKGNGDEFPLFQAGQGLAHCT